MNPTPVIVDSSSLPACPMPLQTTHLPLSGDPWSKTQLPLQAYSCQPSWLLFSKKCLPPLSHINLAWNYVQLLTPHLSPYLNTDSLFIYGSFIQQSSFKQPSAHSL